MVAAQGKIGNMIDDYARKPTRHSRREFSELLGVLHAFFALVAQDFRPFAFWPLFNWTAKSVSQRHMQVKCIILANQPADFGQTIVKVRRELPLAA